MTLRCHGKTGMSASSGAVRRSRSERQCLPLHVISALCCCEAHSMIAVALRGVRCLFMLSTPKHLTPLETGPTKD